MRCREDTLRFWPRLWPLAANGNLISLRDTENLSHFTGRGPEHEPPAFLSNSIQRPVTVQSRNSIRSKCYCAWEVKLRQNAGPQGGRFARRQRTELLTDLLGADKHASPTLFCPVQLPEGHLALIKIPSALLMQKSSSWAAARTNALGSSCARPAVSKPAWTNRSQTSTPRQCQPYKRSLCRMCLRQSVLSTQRCKSQSSHRGMHQNKSRTRFSVAIRQ